MKVKPFFVVPERSDDGSVPPRTELVPPAPRSRTRLVGFAPTVREPEVVLPFPSPLTPLTRVKGTLLSASLRALRDAGYFDAYCGRLDVAQREAVLGCIAGSWVPISVALAHYRACDALALSSAEQMAIGRRTGSGLRHHLTRVAGMLSRASVITPWVIFESFNRFWARSFDGGGVSVLKHGPKEAEIIFARCPLLESPYFRSALRGVAVGLVEAAIRRGFMNELSSGGASHEARYRFSWV